jgi:hypothetical protein
VGTVALYSLQALRADPLKTPLATPHVLLRHVIRLRHPATGYQHSSYSITSCGVSRTNHPLLRKAGATTLLEVYRRARLEQIRHNTLGRAIAQAVSRLLPTAATRVQTRVYSCGICGGQSGAGAGFLRVLPFPLPIFIPTISLQSPSPIIRGWYNRPVVAAVPKVPHH